jgi:P27 family predicted phage terminase small subunit
LKRLEGTYRPDRVVPNEPKPDGTAPAKPGKLDKVAGEKWDLLAPKLHKAGCLTSVDGQALEGYCRAYSRAVKADGLVDAEGLVIDGMNGPMAHPAVKISREAWALVNILGAKLGLSPADRTRVNVTPAPVEDQAEKDLFGRPGLRALEGGRGNE